MIFAPYMTVEAEQHRVSANRVWGGSFVCTYHGDMSPASLAAHYNKRRQNLLDYACKPLNEAAEKYGFEADTYAEQAQKGKAIIFTLESGEQFVPVWALSLDAKERYVENNVLAVEVAKIYASKKPTDEPYHFCRFMAEKVVGMSPNCLYSEINEGQMLTDEFRPRAFERLLAKEQPRALFHTLMFAVTMSHGDNTAYVAQCMHNIVPYLLNPNHTKPDNIELVVNTMIPMLRTAPQRLTA